MGQHPHGVALTRNEANMCTEARLASTTTSQLISRPGRVFVPGEGLEPGDEIEKGPCGVVLRQPHPCPNLTLTGRS
jgi:hypothetical protein